MWISAKSTNQTFSMASNEVNASFNPFSDDILDDTIPEFNQTRIVFNEPGDEFDLTEFPISLDTDWRPLTIPENAESALILEQPIRPETSRRQIPVYTVGWSSTNDAQMMPITGLDFLTGVHQIALQQTVTNLATPNGSAKRYIIKIPNGETLYHTLENSTELCRLCCGSQRSFAMSILDQTQQEAVRFVRTTGFAFGWVPCVLQELKVYSPDRYLGRITQDFGMTKTSFTVKNNIGKNLFRIFGPNNCGWSMPVDAHFVVAGESGGGRLGEMNRRWNNSLCDYNIMVSFPAPGTPNDQKMLLIGAAMLIEYMFYEHRKTSFIRLC